MKTEQELLKECQEKMIAAKQHAAELYNRLKIWTEISTLTGAVEVKKTQYFIKVLEYDFFSSGHVQEKNKNGEPLTISETLAAINCVEKYLAGILAGYGMRGQK